MFACFIISRFLGTGAFVRCPTCELEKRKPFVMISSINKWKLIVKVKALFRGRSAHMSEEKCWFMYTFPESRYLFRQRNLSAKIMVTSRRSNWSDCVKQCTEGKHHRDAKVINYCIRLFNMARKKQSSVTERGLTRNQSTSTELILTLFEHFIDCYFF